MLEEEERYEVVGQKPVMVTRLEDGERVNLRPGDDPVAVRKDRFFENARNEGYLRKVWVEVEDEGDGEGSDEGEAPTSPLDGGASLPVDDLGLSGSIVEALLEAGHETVADLREHGLDDLEEITDIGESRADEIRNAVD